MKQDILATLPDDLLLDIVEHLDTARDVAHLGATSPRARNLIERDGWVSFVKRHFPSLSLPPTEPLKWRAMADRLTYLDNCWEKRAFVLSEYTEKTAVGADGRQPRRNQSVAPASVVTATYSPSTQHEFVAWGSGENLVVQSKSGNGKNANKSRRWNQLSGTSQGYAPGTGDVTALSIIDRHGTPQIAVARADGNVQLLSLARETFGHPVQQLEAPNAASLRQQLAEGSAAASLASPGQMAISWTEWQPQANLLATCKSSTVTLYDLTDSESPKLSPIAHESLAAQTAANELSLVRSVKFMNKDTIVCALGGSREPLRCAKLTPTGLQFVDIAKNARIAQVVATHSESLGREKTTVRAVEPVAGGSGDNLLLSAWEDGTYRLIDIRTPSAYDAVYCDRLQPYDAGSSLLVYGTDRFVAGSNAKPNILFFDFRNPKHYHWTTATSCSSDEPYPAPPRHSSAKKVNGAHLQKACAACNRTDGTVCLWHTQSRSDRFRPDATMMIGNRDYDRVHSLAKVSDVSDRFWCGLRGCVYEARLMLADDTTINNVRGSAPSGWRVHKPTPKISFVETGLGLRDSNDWSDSQWAVNISEYNFKFRGMKGKKSDPRARLDPSVMK